MNQYKVVICTNLNNDTNITIIEDHVIAEGYSTVHNFSDMESHQPHILHSPNSKPKGQMAISHTFTIEPMICVSISKKSAVAS